MNYLTEYQKFTPSTSKSTATSKDYLYWGLIGEIGEVASVLAKIPIRDEYSPQITQSKLRDELGDICWFISQICNYCDLKLTYSGIPILSGKLTYSGIPILSGKFDYSEELFDFATLFKIDELEQRLVYMALEAVSSLGHKYGLTLEEIIEFNISKLTQRHLKTA
ncbi:hypothetical protein [Myxosarcina sp. GI1(2024)]